MKRVGIRQFRDHATRYLAGSDVLAIERHGRPIGFYVPAAASQQETIAQALEQTSPELPLHIPVESVTNRVQSGPLDSRPRNRSPLPGVASLCR